MTTTRLTSPHRRRRARLVVPLVALLALAACGGDDDESADTADAVTTAEGGGITTAGSATTMAGGETPAPPVTSGSAGGDTTVTGGGETTAPAAPFPFTAPEGDYTVVFPGEPEETNQETPLPDGSTLPITFYLYQTSEMAFGTAAIAYPIGTTIDLEGARDGAIMSVGGTLLSSVPIELQGRQGLQFVGDVGGQGTYISRVFADGLRLYQVVAVVQGEAAAEDPEIAAFLDTFQFTS